MPKKESSDLLEKVDKKEKNKKMLSKNGIVVDLPKEELLRIYYLMNLSRQIDNKAMTLLKQGKTFFHIACSGHEAVQAALGIMMDPAKDWSFPYYRDLTFILCLGYTAGDFFLQCLAKDDDPSGGGRQLPCHWGTNRNFKLPSQSSPTGTQFLQAVGTALASVKKGINSVSYVSSGEGTTSQGEFHEAVNWASREKLPVLFHIENNKYAISVPVWKQSGGEGHSISEMMKGYHNLLRMKIDGTDFIESYITARDAFNYLRSGKGPVLIESDVVRLQSHSSSDDQKKYRDHSEIEEDLKKCPIDKFRRQVLENELATEKELNDVLAKVQSDIDKAVEFATQAPDPLPGEASRYVYDESGFKESFEYEQEETTGSNIVMVDAINHCLHEELERNPDIYVFGEDIADNKGGVFTATKGLSTKFGDERVFNSPLAEASIMGVAIGMSLAGLKPVVEIQFGDYIWPAFMQMKDELATIRYRSKNAWASPVVTRVAVGGYIHGGLYHSQNIESIFAHVPGIYIAFPSNAADAKGLLRTAIRINDPVLFCEHKGLYRQSYAISTEPGKDYLLPFGRGKVVREGTDITVVTYGASVWDAVFAAKRLEDEGVSVEVVDLRTIIPLDEELIYSSVQKTNKVIVLHEDTLTGGFGAEVAARIADNCFRFLDAPVKRIAAQDAHIPYSPILENAILPSREVVYKGIKELAQY
ncbi:MAG: tungsten formylmethanofuran dehydrogenase [Ignavibacteriaceae bacterium]|nr:tungsten formylmethanofuran dehydrogenase [Ignavibacteriaceae bacterium]